MKMSDVLKKSELTLWQNYCDKKIECERLTEENAKLREALGNLVKESLSLADFKNKTLKRSICSTDLDEPEWHDYQTIAEADLLLNQLKDKTNDK